MKSFENIVIIGGGLAGLCAAIQLRLTNISVTLIERKTYPFHRVCGEYISNEALPFLNSIGINTNLLGVSRINKLKVSSTSGKIFESNLALGGFGISRYKLDLHLYELAQSLGVDCITGTKVNEVIYDNEQDNFIINCSNSIQLKSKIVIGSFGKRSTLDQYLNRDFLKNRSPYLGVKYHIKTDHPVDLIQLDNFKNGYCGISKIEDDLYCLCYLSHRDNLKEFKTIPEMEKNILYKNPYLKRWFTQSEFIFEKPEVINEISFEKKNLVQEHILFCGDAAGMITPLCGNGMAMAMHGSKILSDLLINEFANKGVLNRSKLELDYVKKWNETFGKRLKWGRRIQSVFGKEKLTAITINGMNTFPYLKNKIVALTHGNYF